MRLTHSFVDICAFLAWRADTPRVERLLGSWSSRLGWPDVAGSWPDPEAAPPLLPGGVVPIGSRRALSDSHDEPDVLS